MTIQEIQAKIEEQLLTLRETEPRQYALAPYRPCPVCPGVLREEGKGYMVCWTCMTTVGLPVERL